MKLLRKLFFLLTSTSLLLNSCVSTTADTEPPEIYDDMTTDEAVDAAAAHGTVTLKKVKNLIEKQKRQADVKKYLDKKLLGSLSAYEDFQLMNLMNLYHAYHGDNAVKLFSHLISYEKVFIKTLAWNLAADFPSKQMAAAIDSEFSRKLASGSEGDLYLAPMALAVQINRLESSYTVVRAGLFAKGDVDFARAMLNLNPKRASQDFITYLAKSNGEELRQLNQKSVNMHTCVVILKHLSAFPASINDQNFSVLFFYAVSRNRSLAELAQTVLQKHMAEDRETVALMLSRMPRWTQIAFVDDIRRQSSPYKATFLAELKQLTPHKTVVEEIRDGH